MSMVTRKRRRLTQAELRALGITPGLMAARIGPDGRVRVEQLQLANCGGSRADNTERNGDELQRA